MHPSLPDLLLARPDLVAEAAPWCRRLDNLELGILLLAQPWLAGGGALRAELERRLAALGEELPLGPVYFQRVHRAVERLAEEGALASDGGGRRRRFQMTPEGMAALVVNLCVLAADPTVDGSEFELKRALVALWGRVLARLRQAGGGAAEGGGEREGFFERVEAIEVLGRRVVDAETVGRALDVRALIALQRRRVERLLERARRRLADPSVDLGAIDLAAAGEGLGAQLVRELALAELPRLDLEARVRRYGAYLAYLGSLDELYAGEVAADGLAALRRVAGGGGG